MLQALVMVAVEGADVCGVLLSAELLPASPLLPEEELPGRISICSPLLAAAEDDDAQEDEDAAA